MRTQSPHEPPAEMAYLIVAHHQPAHLARLIRAMDLKNNHFFIHIDKNAALEPFAAAVPRQANIVFLTDRVPVSWGTLSIVLAVLKLLHAAVASNRAFKYYTLLSGSDYPIKDRREIDARLQDSDRQFIRIDRKLAGEPRNAHFRFIERLPPGTYFGDLIPYHGSMYWSLTADCVRFILAFLNENPGFIDLHQCVFAPDEIFFHSIVKASPFAEAIVHDFERGPCADHVHHANHYIDWAGKRQRDNLTLDERDLQDLLASDALFARKFHQERSRRLLDLIDDHVHAIGQVQGELPRLSEGGGERANLPAVSCFCLTYARPRVLEEAIHSFLQQDYAGPKEMIVLNDYADQTLVFDHPEVRVINVPRRFRSLGEKLNAAVALASHDLLFAWDDDDIYLPHRLSFSVARFEPRKGFFKAESAWVWNDQALSGPMQNIFHAGSCWSRGLFDAVRGYPAEGSGCDQIFEARLAAAFPGSIAPWAVTPSEIYYVYRWAGTGSYHLSVQGGAQIERSRKYAEVAAYVEQRAAAGEIPRGQIALQPCWRADYRQLAAVQMASLAEDGAEDRAGGWGAGEREVISAAAEDLHRTSTLQPIQGGNE
jgi:Core-2/I-Branching enzyme/Glycosyl transferase family 2